MAIAAILNRSGKLTGRGATWTRTHVRGLRNTNGVAPIFTAFVMCVLVPSL
jgi:hypothetical protein